MRGDPKFSVIIATYNRRDYFLQAVQSVVEQTYPAHEIIVVVDGSNDGSAQAVRERFPGVVVIEQPNLGRAVAANTGVARATGDFVCFLDDDDLWHREKLARTRDYLIANPGCCAVNNPVWFFSSSEDGPAGGFGMKRDFVARDLEECHRMAAGADASANDISYLDIRGSSFRMLLERNRGVMSATAVERRTLLRAGGFSPEFGYSDDWNMFVNVARLCEWHTVPQRLGFTRLHEGQSTACSSSSLPLLAPLVAAWYGGRPLPHRADQVEVQRSLAAYGYEYRRLVQNCLWGAVRSGELRTAAAVRRFGWLLLPRFLDRLYAAVPPPVTWRFERYVLGMHK